MKKTYTSVLSTLFLGSTLLLVACGQNDAHPGAPAGTLPKTTEAKPQPSPDTVAESLRATIPEERRDAVHEVVAAGQAADTETPSETSETTTP